MELRFEAVGDWFAVMGLISLAFLGLAVAELIWDRVTGARPRLAETGANMAIAVGNELLNRTA